MSDVGPSEAAPAVYLLRRLVMNSPPAIALTEQEFLSIRRSKNLVLQALAIEERYELAVANFQEFEKTLNDLALEHMLRHDVDYHSLNDVRVLVNQRVVNVLSACNLYLDHLDSRVSEAKRDWPELDIDPEAVRQEQHASSAEYQIAYELRNHAIHRGFPILGVSPRGEWVDRGGRNSALRYRLDAIVDTDGMKDSASTKKHALAALKARPGKIDARWVLRGYLAAINQIHIKIREALQPLVQQSEQVLLATIDRFRTDFPSEPSMIGLAALVFQSDGLERERVEVFTDIIERYRYLLRRNAEMPSLSLMHVSSEPCG